MKLLISASLIVCVYVHAFSQNHSVARKWNEATLIAIRNDFARPTVHARNLFHTSIALYDSWAIFNEQSTTYLLGKSHGDFTSSFEKNAIESNQTESYIEEVASFAIYQILRYRFRNSPGVIESTAYFDELMNELGYNINQTSDDYSDGKASSLGNFIALEIINYGLLDGSNEAIDYNNVYYEPINPPLILSQSGNPNMVDPDRWQPLAFDTFIDQSGNPIPGNIPEFLGPEWGNVRGFTLHNTSAMMYERDNNNYYVYHDPGAPPYLQGAEQERKQYQWGFSMVSHWSSHLDANDGVIWDISPSSIGNLQKLPSSVEEYPNFYHPEGGDNSSGYKLNPKTNSPYAQQLVPRGDYTRVLAEFWADGPDSETPPGHWFTLLNYVMDQPTFERKYKGAALMNTLEYDVKAYFMLGAAMHDVAITAWALKGWYDYVRPISAIRYMNGQGQSTDLTASNYNPQGLPLAEGLVEVVKEDDALASNPDNIGKIKLKAWKGPDYILNPNTDIAGVDWILAENWWPYQRPTFVTPPFAGYISGHSTYSRAAAEVLTMLTGDPYFPGGIGEFVARKNDFLVFEEGPSTDVVLQWATYRDASDQCSLSRIWGGIHPPADDIPGRKIGITIANDVFELADNYFNGVVPLELEHDIKASLSIYPNPVSSSHDITLKSSLNNDSVILFSLDGTAINTIATKRGITKINSSNLSAGIYFLKSTSTLEIVKLIIR